MAGRNPEDAFKNFINPMKRAVGCVTRVPLTLRERDSLVINKPYSISLNITDPVLLKGEMPVGLIAAQVIRIIEAEDSDLGPYKIQTIQYFYSITTATGDEVLTFQWAPEAQGRGAITFPHLHVGSVMIDKAEAPLRPDTFHKVHIPTSRVSLEAIVRLAIEEFGVKPLKPRWRTILGASEGAFIRWKTR